MRAILQRVTHSSVTVDSEVVGEISKGLLLYLGIAPEDTLEDIQWLIKKLTQLKLFEGEVGRMSKNLNEIHGSVLVISQFTLHASIKKGTRPSFHRAAPPEIAERLYKTFLMHLEDATVGEIQSGLFGAHMEVSLLNDGPITLILDSQRPE